MKHIDHLMIPFREFLTHSWPRIPECIAQDEDLLGDWKQANWKILVEAPFRLAGGGFLEVYADGADCNDASSRVWMPGALPTHRVVCVPREDGMVRDYLTDRSLDPASLEFDRFVSWENERYAEEPPFAHVRFEEGKEGQRIASVGDLRFEACRRAEQI